MQLNHDIIKLKRRVASPFSEILNMSLDSVYYYSVLTSAAKLEEISFWWLDCQLVSCISTHVTMYMLSMTMSINVNTYFCSMQIGSAATTTVTWLLLGRINEICKHTTAIRHAPHLKSFNKVIHHFIMAALQNRADHYIFILWFLLFLSISFFPHLISAVADWMSAILPHMVWP